MRRTIFFVLVGVYIGCFLLDASGQEASRTKDQSQLLISGKKKISPEVEKQYLKEHPEANFVLDADTQQKQQTAPKPRPVDTRTKESVVLRELPAGKSSK